MVAQGKRWWGFVQIGLLAAVVGAPAGCEAIAGARGMIAAAKEVEEHLPDDLEAELTDAKIDKVLEVTPEFVAFAEASKYKWTPNPGDPDFRKLATALAGLADYIAFFEARGTRITEYYVDLVKISDARFLIEMRKAHREALAELDEERKGLEAELAKAKGDARPPLEKRLEQNALARKSVQDTYERGRKAREEQRAQAAGGYSLSDEEVTRVGKREKEIVEVFAQAGYIQKSAAQT